MRHRHHGKSGSDRYRRFCRTGCFLGVVSAVLFSIRNLSQKYHFRTVPSDRLMFHQVLTIALMLIPFVAVRDAAALSFPHWGSLLALGLLSTATAHTLYSYSLKLLAAKSVALIGCLQPLVAAVLAWLVLQEIPSLCCCGRGDHPACCHV